MLLRHNAVQDARHVQSRHYISLLAATQRLVELPFFSPPWLVCAGRAAASSSDMDDRNSLQLHLQDLNLDNVDALEGLKLNIQVIILHTSFCRQSFCRDT